MKSKSKTGAKPSHRARRRRSKWEMYEFIKAQLPGTLSSAEHEAACRRIARDLGI